MAYELEKVGFFKRMTAYLLDGTLVVILAVALALLLTNVLGFSAYNDKVTAAYERYEAQYNTSFQVTGTEYNSWTEEQKQALEDASAALLADEEAMYNYHMTVNIMIITVAVSLLLPLLVVELLIPLLLKNGQTLGKKIVGLCVVRTDCVRITGLQLTLRTVLGKALIETLIPALILLLMVFGIVSTSAAVVVAIVFIGQGIALMATGHNAAIHDLISGTAVSDFRSQLIFDSAEEKTAFEKKVQTERAAKN